MFYTNIISLTLSDGMMILLAYLIGGISPGYLLVRILLDTDLRTVGSGSLGATNVGRVLGKKGFYFTLAADILKGALMVWLARWLEFSPGVVAAVAVVVIAGHIWPLWHHFHGGKGIATGFGAFVTLDYKIALFGVAVLLVTYMMTRRFLPSWVFTLVVLPPLAYTLDYPMTVVASLIPAVAIIIFAHKENIRQSGFLSVKKG